MFYGVLLKHEVSYYYKYNIFDNCHRVDAVGYWVDKKERSFIHTETYLCYHYSKEVCAYLRKWDWRNFSNFECGHYFPTFLSWWVNVIELAKIRLSFSPFSHRDLWWLWINMQLLKVSTNLQWHLRPSKLLHLCDAHQEMQSRAEAAQCAWLLLVLWCR